MYDAECRGMPPSVFFPERGQTARLAKQTCAVCAVSQQCREYGLFTGEEGVFGGMPDRERQAERRRRGIVLRNNGVTNTVIWTHGEEDTCERVS